MERGIAHYKEHLSIGKPLLYDSEHVLKYLDLLMHREVMFEHHIQTGLFPHSLPQEHTTGAAYVYDPSMTSVTHHAAVIRWKHYIERHLKLVKSGFPML